MVFVVDRRTFVVSGLVLLAMILMDGAREGEIQSAAMAMASGFALVHSSPRALAPPSRLATMLVVLPPIEQLEARVAAMMTRWRVPPGPLVTVAWNPRLRTTAGRAFGREGRIELNPELLALSPKELDTVLVHEAAHLAAFRLFGARCPAHGRHWRGLMRLAGLPPDVTHDLPLPPRVRRGHRRHIYLRLCDACGARRIARAVRYERCACGVTSQFLVLRAPATEGGLETLREMPVAEVRQRCART